jgi:predicted enzyme related to lactoylglutathione lyase
MRSDYKLDYVEMQAGNGMLDSVKSFYSAAFGWTFTDYGPAYAAFSEGLDGGFDASSDQTVKPLPIIYASSLERAAEVVEKAGGTIVKPIFPFPGGRRFHFTDPAGNELAVWSDGPVPSA